MEKPSPSFNPWPYGIIAAFVVFISATATLIVIATHNRMDLVTHDYYEQEVRYQQQMDRVTRTGALKSRGRIIHEAASSRVRIELPAEHAGREATGRIVFYRPSAAGQDRQFDLKPDAAGAQSLDVSNLPSGPWKVRVLWAVGAEEFFLEQPLEVRPRA